MRRPSARQTPERAAGAAPPLRRRSVRRRAAVVATTVVVVGGICGAPALGGPAVAGGPAAASAAQAPRCATPAPRARGAGSSAAAVRRLARRVGTTTSKRPRIGSPTSRPPRRLVRDDVVRCRGTRAKLGDTIRVRYSLVVWGGRSRTVDSTWGRSGPVEFGLEKGGLITGWTEGIPGMQVGSRRLLVVPPGKGYGRTGTPDGGVPPDATLIFVVDLVDVS